MPFLAWNQFDSLARECAITTAQGAALSALTAQQINACSITTAQAAQAADISAEGRDRHRRRISGKRDVPQANGCTVEGEQGQQLAEVLCRSRQNATVVVSQAQQASGQGYVTQRSQAVAAAGQGAQGSQILASQTQMAVGEARQLGQQADMASEVERTHRFALADLDEDLYLALFGKAA